WLFRCPTYKEQLQEVKDKDLHNLGFLGYPVLQAADILLYKADAVPVGEDQLPHLELTREICRRFTNFYGRIFPEPQGLLTKYPRVPGIDARKMSKSYGNAITLDEDPQELKGKVMRMFTDPKKIRATDPGHPEGCVVFAFHALFNPNYTTREVECKSCGIGCVACKQQLITLMTDATAPLREKRRAFAAQKDLVPSILERGRLKAKEAAGRTMEEVRKAVLHK
ncbi:MAG: tryptophan--tRNA ligase, partial [Elusimicrobia bacterium RIFOXYA2_FULL_50_26]